LLDPIAGISLTSNYDLGEGEASALGATADNTASSILRPKIREPLLMPGPAGQVMHLMPIFGSGLAILLLGERFTTFHFAGAALIAIGLGLAALTRP
jgi:hypothetical protein